jgi:hypothetical protein
MREASLGYLLAVTVSEHIDLRKYSICEEFDDLCGEISNSWNLEFDRAGPGGWKEVLWIRRK